jgi:hypothetical protein
LRFRQKGAEVNSHQYGRKTEDHRLPNTFGDSRVCEGSSEDAGQAEKRMNIHEEIIPNLGALQSAITLSLKGYREAAYRLELLPYCLGSALTVLAEARERPDEVISAIELQKLGVNVDYVVPV